MSSIIPNNTVYLYSDIIRSLLNLTPSSKINDDGSFLATHLYTNSLSSEFIENIVE